MTPWISAGLAALALAVLYLDYSLDGLSERQPRMPVRKLRMVHLFMFSGLWVAGWVTLRIWLEGRGWQGWDLNWLRIGAVIAGLVLGGAIMGRLPRKQAFATGK